MGAHLERHPEEQGNVEERRWLRNCSRVVEDGVELVVYTEVSPKHNKVD